MIIESIHSIHVSFNRIANINTILLFFQTSIDSIGKSLIRL